MEKTAESARLKRLSPAAKRGYAGPVETVPRTCEGCGRPLPLLARPDRRHCSSICRLIAFRRRQQAALAEAVLVGDIQQAGAMDWRAAAFLLERHYPERWGHDARGEDVLDVELEEEPWT